MVQVLTGAQVGEEHAHEQYIKNLHLKLSSYKFYYKYQSHTCTTEKGWTLGIGAVL